LFIDSTNDNIIKHQGCQVLKTFPAKLIAKARQKIAKSLPIMPGFHHSVATTTMHHHHHFL